MVIMFAKELVGQRYIHDMKITRGFLIPCKSVIRWMNVSCYYGMSNGKDRGNKGRMGTLKEIVIVMS